METSTCDLADLHGPAARVLPIGLRHFGGRRRFAGPAATVRCLEDNALVREIATTPGQGRVLVVDGGGSTRCALVGDVVAGNALANGWAGIVVIGAVRDSAALAGLDLGVVALATNPRRAGRAGTGEVGIALEIDGAACAPGDMVVADDDGVLVLDAALAPPDGG